MTATRHSPLTDSPPDAGAPARALTLSEGVTDGQGDAMDDGRLVLALRAHDPAAAALLFDRYAPHVRRILARVMGFDAELADLLHDVFVAALGSIHTLHQPERLKAWLTSIAVFTARRCIRRRRARRWLLCVGTIKPTWGRSKRGYNSSYVLTSPTATIQKPSRRRAYR